MDKTSNVEKTDLLQHHPAFGNNIAQFDKDTNKKRKRSHSSDLSDESDSDNDAYVKRTKTNSINDESTNEIVKKLVNVAAGLIGDVNRVSKKQDNLETEMKQVHGTFRKVAKDMDKAEDKIDENKRNINRDKLFKQMIGSGIDMDMKRFYQKIMDENPNLIKDIKETMKSVDAIQEHTFFKEELKEADKIKKKIMEIEKCFINTMEIRNLFKRDMIEDVKFKIEKLQNAAKVAKEMVELSEEEQLMLTVITYSSKIKAMDLLDEWFYNIKSIFDRLPSDEDLKYKAKELTKEYKLAKEKEMKIELGEDNDAEASEISETDSSDNEEDQNKDHNSEDADNEASEIIEASDDDDDDDNDDDDVYDDDE